LLNLKEIQTFMREKAYQERKVQRFRLGDELLIRNNPAFKLDDPVQRELFAREYRKSSDLYYQGQPDFELLLAKITQHIDDM